jgi:8-oxo-dGTP diphosphatase
MNTSSKSRTHYCLGFAVDETGDQAALIQKNRPDFLIGKWTGVGGHVETGETAQEAVAREFMEEAGVAHPVASWKALARRENEDWVLDVFATVLDVRKAHTLTEEPISIVAMENMPDEAQLGPNFLKDIAMALQVLGIHPKNADTIEADQEKSKSSRPRI